MNYLKPTFSVAQPGFSAPGTCDRCVWGRGSHSATCRKGQIEYRRAQLGPRPHIRKYIPQRDQGLRVWWYVDTVPDGLGSCASCARFSTWTQAVRWAVGLNPKTTPAIDSRDPFRF